MPEHHPLVEAADLGMLVALLALAPVAALVPERHWRPLGLIVAALASRLRAARAASQRAAIAGALGPAALPATADAIHRHLLGGKVEHLLETLRDAMPGRWRPQIALCGRRHLEQALAGGRGAILWVAPFRASTLVSKQALHAAGFAVSHLSDRYHGPCDSRLGRRLINPLQVAAELRYLGERVVTAEGKELQTVRILKERLRTNHPVSITYAPCGRRLLMLPLLAARLPVATGAPSLALASGAPLLPLITLQDGPGACRVLLEAPLQPPAEAPRHVAVQALAEQYAACVERHLRARPLLCEAWRHLAPPADGAPPASER